MKIKHTKSVEEFRLLLQFHHAFVVVHRGLFFSELFILFQNYLAHQDDKGKNEHSIYRLTSLKDPRASLQTQQTSSCISCHLVCDCFLLTDGKRIDRKSP